MKRPRLTAEDLTAYFANAPEATEPQAERHTYLVPDAMHDQLKAIAQAEGVGINELVRWVLERFVGNHRKGTIKVPVQEYLTTRRVLEAD